MIALRSYFKKIFSRFSLPRVMPILRAAWPFAISGALGLLFTNSDILIISWMRSRVGGGHLFRRHPHHPDVLSDPEHHPARHASRPLAPRKDGQRALPERVRADARHGIPRFHPALARRDRARHADHELHLRRARTRRAASRSSYSRRRSSSISPPSIVINALFAYDHQKSLIVSSALGGVVNVGLDLALIPFFGITGSAVATLIAQAVNNGYLWYAMKKVNPFTVMGSP